MYTVADTPLPEMPAFQPQEALDTAYKNRPELRTLELNMAAANVALALQKSQASAVVSVNGSLGIGQDWTANVSSGAFTAGVSIALPPILDGGLQGAQVQQASDLISSYQVQQDQQRQSITIAVENALFSVRDSKDRLDLAGQNVQQAQGVYELQKAKRAVGLETTLDVLTAFSTLITAEVGLEQAHSNYLLADSESLQCRWVCEGVRKMKTGPKVIIIVGAVIMAWRRRPARPAAALCTAGRDPLCHAPGGARGHLRNGQ